MKSNIDQIEEHFRAHKDTLVKKMVRRAGTEWAAEDIVGETYYRALKYHAGFYGDDIARWINTIYNNCLREYQNMEKGYSYLDDDSPEASYECPQEVIHVMKDVHDLISTKSVVQMEILGLYFKQEYGCKAISEITAYKYSRVHQCVARFKEELRQLYKE